MAPFGTKKGAQSLSYKKERGLERTLLYMLWLIWDADLKLFLKVCVIPLETNQWKHAREMLTQR